MIAERSAFTETVIKTIIVHTVTYFFVGVLAFVTLDYSTRYAAPGWVLGIVFSLIIVLTTLGLVARPATWRAIRLAFGRPNCESSLAHDGGRLTSGPRANIFINTQYRYVSYP